VLSERLSRSVAKVQREVDEAMLRFDHDSGGSLSFTEFVAMVADSGAFNFRVDDAVIARVATMQTELALEAAQKVARQVRPSSPRGVLEATP